MRCEGLANQADDPALFAQGHRSDGRGAWLFLGGGLQRLGQCGHGHDGQCTSAGKPPFENERAHTVQGRLEQHIEDEMYSLN